MTLTLEQLQALTDEQLIEKVAVEVMGWKNVWCMKCHNTGLHLGRYRMPCRECASWRGLGLTLPPRPWNPLTDWNHTMEVVERMHGIQNKSGDHWDFLLEWDGDRVMVRFGDLSDDCSSIDSESSPQRAICLAALLAVQ